MIPEYQCKECGNVFHEGMCPNCGCWDFLVLTGEPPEEDEDENMSGSDAE